MKRHIIGSFDLSSNLKAPLNLEDLFEENTQRTYSTWFFESRASELNFLCDKYNTDKGGFDPDHKTYTWASHNYAYFYEHLFQHIRPYVRNVFEFGLGTNDPSYADNMTVNGMPGASLRVWRDYFPLANIYGADIDKNVLFEEDKIKTFYVDQLKAETFEELWSGFADIQFDIMIDDGLHTFDAGINTFLHSYHKLREGGIYVIEDVRGASPLQFLSFFKEHREYDAQFVWLNRSNGSRHDCLAVIRKRYGAAQ